MSNEEITRRKTSFTPHKMIFFHFSSIWTPPTFKASNFFELKSMIEQHTRKFLGDQKWAL
jgi:hypothetical protein